MGVEKFQRHKTICARVEMVTLKKAQSDEVSGIGQSEGHSIRTIPDLMSLYTADRY